MKTVVICPAGKCERITISLLMKTKKYENDNNSFDVALVSTSGTIKNRSFCASFIQTAAEHA